jgi:hypothetical protein
VRMLERRGQPAEKRGMKSQNQEKNTGAQGEIAWRIYSTVA